MLRSPQHLILQLSVAPTRRTLTTAATSHSSSDKAPPPPAFVSSGLAPSSEPPAAAVASTANTTSAAFRVGRMSSDAAAAPHHGQPPAVPAPQRHSATQPKARSEERLASSNESQSGASHTQTRSSSRITSYFPLGYKEAMQQWWSNVSASTAERNVLAYVPFLREAKMGSQPNLTLTPQQQQQQQQLDGGPSLSAIDSSSGDPYGSRLWRSQMVPLPGKNRALNEYSIERAGEDASDTLVMLHGYGAGLGFFYRNFDALSRIPGWRLFALDMLGMGNSSRPPFKISAKDPQAKITEAENWFIDALEEWRLARKIERFTLLGHSLGGYLAVSYALKYPGHINKLILASPVGVPEDPYAVNAAMPEPEDSTVASEFIQDQEAIVHDTTASATASAATSGTHNKPNHNYRLNHNHSHKKAATTKPERRPLPGWLVWLWDANVSPFSLVRASGPLGPRLVSGWTSRRFSHLPPAEANALHTYAYTLFRQRGSGEYALPYLLAPGAYARRPVINRIADVGRQVIQPAQPATATTPAKPAVREAGFPIVMMYGDHDWMDVAGGYAAEEKLKQRIVQALLHGTPEEKRRENGSAKVVLVRNAGHHLYLDNPDDFNDVLQKELVDTQANERRRRQQKLDEV
ncbi:alpha beta hydrolase fold family [Niveomyces insectorum RCEF 264]|uniref:Alpha beta hydrolase fold family n=1 Tax=Niveomyces insectorum RCEF 264 TaxID=1081102 RepID=A0A167QYQ9_9HYPO|nr:alpha beta hydrolase fold family [Niveomyces insectorum RCEF 264]